MSTNKSSQSPQAGKKVVKKKKVANVPAGVVHVNATFNNTIITITDMSGHVVSWASAGRVNFHHSKKSSAYAGTVAAQSAARDAMSIGMKEVKVKIRGPGAGRESAVRGIQSAGLMITEIEDATPVPHNGCRSRKRRRV